jgi:hypothetical protein
VFSDHISNFDIFAIHPSICHHIVSFISFLVAAAVAGCVFTLNKRFILFRSTLRCEGLSLTVWIVRCEGLPLTAGLNKFFKYLATIVLDLVCSEQICSLTIFVHGLTEDESHKNFICIYNYITSSM